MCLLLRRQRQPFGGNFSKISWAGECPQSTGQPWTRHHSFLRPPYAALVVVGQHRVCTPWGSGRNITATSSILGTEVCVHRKGAAGCSAPQSPQLPPRPSDWLVPPTTPSDGLLKDGSAGGQVRPPGWGLQLPRPCPGTPHLPPEGQWGPGDAILGPWARKVGTVPEGRWRWRCYRRGSDRTAVPPIQCKQGTAHLVPPPGAAPFCSRCLLWPWVPAPPWAPETPSRKPHSRC